MFLIVPTANGGRLAVNLDHVAEIFPAETDARWCVLYRTGDLIEVRVAARMETVLTAIRTNQREVPREEPADAEARALESATRALAGGPLPVTPQMVASMLTVLDPYTRRSHLALPDRFRKALERNGHDADAWFTQTVALLRADGIPLPGEG